MRIHLVTYATPRFKLRQHFLGASAKLNHVTDEVTLWNPEMLLKAGFECRVKNIRLTERGSGFWAWKPFIIDSKLREVAEGDIVFYCDVGRLYPFKMLNQPITPYLKWMDDRSQDIMPGVEIPWSGPNSTWIKREALVALDMDDVATHQASPIQASFSIWRASARSRDFANEWLDLCSRRELVSDDPSRKSLSELADFRGHRHDQALLSLLCLKRKLHGLSLGEDNPLIDTRHPSVVSRIVWGESPSTTASGKVLRAVVWPVERTEQLIRQNLKFGKPIQE